MESYQIQYLNKNQKHFFLIPDYPCSKDTPGHIPELISQGPQSLVQLYCVEAAAK